jgi:hypothetical protein
MDRVSVDCLSYREGICCTCCVSDKKSGIRQKRKVRKEMRKLSETKNMWNEGKKVSRLRCGHWEINGLVLLQPDVFLPNRAPPRRRLIWSGNKRCPRGGGVNEQSNY